MQAILQSRSRAARLSFSKAWRLLLGLVLLLGSSGGAWAQGVGGYSTARTTGNTYTSIAGTGTSYAWRAGLSTDDNLSTATPIGFTFAYNGATYTQFSISTNGFLTFNTGTAAIGSGTSAYGYQNTQFSVLGTATVGTVNTLAPFYDDQQTAGNLSTLADLNASLKYLTTGTAPNRVLTAEWINMQDFSTTSTSSFNYQVKLYELDGHIEFNYGAMALSNTSIVTTMTYSLGINSLTGGPTLANLLTLQTANTNNFSFTAQDALGGNTTAGLPTANSTYTFTPPGPNDAGIVGLIAPTSPVTPGTQNVTFTVKNFGTVALTSFVINYTINGVVQTPFNFSGSIAAAGGTGSVTVGTFNFPAGLSTISASTSSPNGATDSNPANDAFSTVVSTPLSGTYTINNGSPTGGTNFISFTDAINTLNAAGVAGAVTFLVSNSQTFNETPPVITATGTSANTITFQEATLSATLTDNPKITPTGGAGTSDGGLIISGGDYFTFDGISIDASAVATLEYGYLVRNASATNGALNNTIRNAAITLNRTNTASAGVLQSSSTTGGGVSATANTGVNQNNRYLGLTVRNAYSGIFLIGVTGFPDFNNEVATCAVGNPATVGDIGGSSTAAYGIRTVFQGQQLVHDNTVTNVNTAAATAYGISIETSAGTGTTTGATVAAPGASSVYNNRVSTVRNTSTTSTSAAHGINAGVVTTGTHTLNIYNNFIWDITSGFTGTATGSRYVRGLYIVGTAVSTSTFNNSFNSVRLETPATFTGSSSCYEITSSGGAIINTRDNIFANFSTGPASTTAKHYTWVSTSATAVGNTGSVSNYNDLYIANQSGTSGFVALGNATTYTLLSDWRTATGQEVNSVSVDPLFTSATDLHLQDASTLNNIGTPVAGVTTDIDGATRSGTSPDIGADEFTPATTDIAITAFNGVVSPFAPGTYPVSITIANNGSTTVTTADISYTFNGVTTNIGTYMFSTPLAPSSTTTVSLGSLTFVSGDNTLSATAINPNGVAETAPANTANNTLAQTFTTALCGNYNVGAGQTFATLDAAVTTLNAAGATCAVTFTLTDATYAASSGITINQFPGSSSANTLTIKPGAGVQPALTATATATFLLRLNGADYVTVDGSNTTGGTTRDLTLTVPNLAASSFVVRLQSIGTGAGATFNTLKNLNITGGGATTNATFGINFSGADNDNLTIQNNSVLGVSTGLQGFGTALVSAGGIDNLFITGNMVGPTSATVGQNINNTGLLISSVVAPSVTNNTVQNVTSAGAILGMQVQSASSLTVTGNSVLNVSSTAAAATGLVILSTTGGLISQNLVQGLSGNSSSSLSAGLVLGSGTTGVVVDRNKLLGLTEVNTSGNGVKGIEVQTATASANVRISNNFVQVNAASGYSGTSFTDIGIRLSTTQSGINIYYNSVNMTGTETFNTATVSSALTVLTGSTGLDIRNNVFRNSITNSANTGAKAYAFYSTAPAAAFTTINYNDYFVSGVQGVLAFFNSADVTTLAALQNATTGTGQDANSLSADPSFVSATNLHTASASLNGVATPIAGLTTDIDGDPRDATLPDIGADEFTPPADDAGVVAITQPVTPFSATVQNVAVQVKNFGLAVLNSVTVSWTVNGVAQTPQPFTGLNLAAGATSADLVLGTFDFSTGGPAFTIVATTSLPNGNPDANSANDSFTRTVAPSLIGTYTVGVGQQFATITNAVNTLNSAGVAGAVTFVLTDALYSTSETFPLVINTVLGGSATNNITIKPNTGVTASVSGSSATAILKLNGADYVTVDGSNNGTATRDLTLTNTGTATDALVVWLASVSASNGATNNVVKNLNVTGGSNTAAASQAGIGLLGTATNLLGQNNDANTVQNNFITKVAYGIDAEATATEAYDNLVLLDNLVGPAISSATDNPTVVGILLVQTPSAQVTHNTVRNVSSSFAGALSAIVLSTGTAGSVVSRNIVRGTLNTTTGGYGVRAISLDPGTGAANITVRNNEVSGTLSDGDNAATLSQVIMGLGFVSGTGYSVYNNSVQMSGDRPNNIYSNKVSAAVFVATAVTGIDLRNNVLSNIQTTSDPDATGMGVNYAVYVQAATGNPFTTIDYNLYDIRSGAAARTAAVSPQFVGRLAGVDRADLAAWKTATGQDVSSMQGNPGFTSATNLAPNPADPNSYYLNGTGVQLASVSQDLTGAVRSTTVAAGAPDLGAYELTPTVAPNPLTVTGTYAPGSTQQFFFAGRQVASIAYDAAGTLPTTLTARYYPGTNPPAPYPATARYYNAYFTFVDSGDGAGFSFTPTLNYDLALLGTIASEAAQRLTRRTGSSGYIADAATVVNTTARTLTGGAPLTAFGLFTVSDAAAPLPVELVSFEAVRQGADAQLDWTTASEKNNRGFEVQVSTDSRTFREIGFVAGAGSSNAPRSYAFTDREAGKSGVRYYRLRQLDFNGVATFSPVRTVAFGLLAENGFSASPNPFVGEFTLQVQAREANAAAPLTFFDATGRPVLKRQLDVPAGASQVPVAGLDSLPSGMYIVQLAVDGRMLYTKLVKQ